MSLDTVRPAGLYLPPTADSEATYGKLNEHQNDLLDAINFYEYDLSAARESLSMTLKAMRRSLDNIRHRVGVDNTVALVNNAVTHGRFPVPDAPQQQVESFAALDNKTRSIMQFIGQGGTQKQVALQWNMPRWQVDRNVSTGYRQVGIDLYTADSKTPAGRRPQLTLARVSMAYFYGNYTSQSQV